MLRKQRILGYRRNGYPIWEIMGGSEPAPEPDGEPGGDSGGNGGPSGPEDPAADGDEPLGEKGQKALDAEKIKRKNAQAELRKFKDLGLTPDQITELVTTQKQRDGDKQPDPEELKKQAKTEAQAELLKERALDKVEVKAARTFADPEDARGFLASRVDEFIDDGQIDSDAIGKALTKLLRDKPYLGATTNGGRFRGDGDGGARKSAKPDPGPGMARLRAAYEESEAR